jgi:hypothetical protein
MDEILSSLRDSCALVGSYPPMNGWAIFDKCMSLNFESQTLAFTPVNATPFSRTIYRGDIWLVQKNVK